VRRYDLLFEHARRARVFAGDFGEPDDFVRGAFELESHLHVEVARHGPAQLGETMRRVHARSRPVASDRTRGEDEIAAHDARETLRDHSNWAISVDPFLYTSISPFAFSAQRSASSSELPE
jgi:hypothetical protein